MAIAPLDFTALMLRATLLDRADPATADEAWEQALAQRPPGDLPPQLEAVLRQGEARVRDRQAQQDERLRAAAADAEMRATPDEKARIDRFRTNALRQTRPYHSEPTHFHFPGLREFEFHPRSAFPWLSELEAATGDIAAELKALLAAERADLVPYVQYDAHAPLNQWRDLNHNTDWSAIHLLQNGGAIEAHAEACPVTIATLARCGQAQIPGRSPNAMFSLLAPRTTIPAHVGVNNARLVCHLPLIVPEGCWFRVGADKRFWKEGEAMVFDDTIEHEASNPSDELRVVLIFDVWHPDLSPVERDAVAAMLAISSGGQSGL
ncbi:aspartyl/asparaginyl beta-hydroxylase domain-containing protein [Sphingomonas sabuli]|uniref:aspartyl/asparaginyl beta-hydroxylase domain-containing protein n=1 Tax=Sphingomonas sabuli TaxID=2764186 RepID=UPI001FEA08DF|nr:aspartyl/asparaginyl beta-hydroxylase domain-containing protein [Sphingomonas sabuli]